MSDRPDIHTVDAFVPGDAGPRKVGTVSAVLGEDGTYAPVPERFAGKPGVVSKRLRYVVLKFDDGINMDDIDRFDDCFVPDRPHPADVFLAQFAAGLHDLGPCTAYPVDREPGAVREAEAVRFRDPLGAYWLEDPGTQLPGNVGGG